MINAATNHPKTPIWYNYGIISCFWNFMVLKTFSLVLFAKMKNIPKGSLIIDNVISKLSLVSALMIACIFYLTKFIQWHKFWDAWADALLTYPGFVQNQMCLLVLWSHNIYWEFWNNVLQPFLNLSYVQWSPNLSQWSETYSWSRWVCYC